MEWMTIVYFLLIITTAVCLIRKYQETNDRGIIWFGIALVLWPLILAVLNLAFNIYARRIDAGVHVGFYPFTLVEIGRIRLGELAFYKTRIFDFISQVLCLIAIINLYKKR